MGGQRTIRLDLQYDGTDFVGWQIQANGRSVQGELARALEKLLQDRVVPVGSGRTDAGTHALGQIAHFHTRSRHSTESIARALNSLLPPDIAVTSASEAATDFHARYSAVGKRYRYRIATAKEAIGRRCVWQLFRPLDLEPMREAAGFLQGTHDFDAFCNCHPPPSSFACSVTDTSWQRRGSELVFEIEANRFVRHMVRIIVGTLVEVGSGRRHPRDVERLLAGSARPDRPPRCSAGSTAPARGLCLLHVQYP